jgi:nicotinamidase-related amidase
VASEPMRDPVTDPLLTPQNSALVVIDYQPSQIQAVTSIDHDLLVRNIVSVARLAKTYGLPILLSTVNVAANGQPPTIPELRDVLSDLAEIDRTQINSWEDTEFRKAVEATGRKKLVVAALWTEVCLAFRLWTRYARATRCSQSSTPSGGHPRRHTGRA